MDLVQWGLHGSWGLAISRRVAAGGRGRRRRFTLRSAYLAGRRILLRELSEQEQQRHRRE
ncbi:MAG: hypothetical protein ACRDRH_21785 [Pseudonocardia sp.]